MARPSDSWEGFAHLGRDSEQYERMKDIQSSADLEYLKERSLKTRSTDRSVTCDIDPSKFSWGFNNIVFEIAFSDGVFWIARVQHVAPDQGNLEERNFFLSEVATMKVISQRTNIPVPQVFDYDVSTDNPFGYRYMILEYVGGQTLDGSLAMTVPSQYHPKVAEQLANVLFELQKLSFDSIGRFLMRSNSSSPEELPELVPTTTGSKQPTTSLEYFYTMKQEENRTALSMHPDDSEWLTACWVLKTALPHIVIEDRINGPFHLCHMDLHHGNLLFDDDFNLTGVMDWSFAQTVPLERLAVCPELITFPGLSQEENRPIVEFKKLVIWALMDKEQKQQSQASMTSTTLSEFMASPRSEITHICSYSTPYRAPWDAKRVAKLMYGDAISWDQLKEVYRAMPYF